MLSISSDDILARIRRDNPWWEKSAANVPEWTYQRRTYFEPFAELALNTKVRRAAVLLGPRRVGKTVMVRQLVQRAIADGFEADAVLYASIDTPIYSSLRLESFVQLLPKGPRPSVVIFDEIQYLKDWEQHLKDLVDSYPHVKFIATGSAAAALRLKSRESGAGRFSEFMLPPLTFHEFLCFLGRDDELIFAAPRQSGQFLFCAFIAEGAHPCQSHDLSRGRYDENEVWPRARESPRSRSHPHITLLLHRWAKHHPRHKDSESS